MTEDPKNRRRPGLEGLDVNLDKLLGSLGEALNAAVSRLDQAQTAGSEGQKTVETPFGPITTSAGMRVRVGGMAAPKSAPSTAKPVNRDRPAPPPQTPKARPLAYDIFEDDEAWILTADMPGVSLEEILLTEEDATLVLVTTGGRVFEARIPLPCPCPLDRIERSLINGVLTLTFPKEGLA